jgi:ribosome-associated translation inhibitor RaiA
MQITVRGKQLDVGDALRTHAEDSLRLVLAKFFSNPIEANVLLSRDAHLYRVRHVQRRASICIARRMTALPGVRSAVEHLSRRLGRQAAAARPSSRRYRA